MNYREHQYYKINRQIKKAYHAAVRRGAGEKETALYREINERIVKLFAQDGLISTEWAAALHYPHLHEDCCCGHDCGE